MESDKQSLFEKLDEMAAILESHGEKHWLRWIRSDSAQLRRGNLEGVRHFLTAFGGMGSLNDLYLCIENGHRISNAEVEAVNARLSRARSEAWTLARALLRAET